MRTFFTLLILFFSHTIFAQVEYEISQDPKHPEVTIYRGTIDKYLLQNTPEFAKWYKQNQQGYAPDSAVLKSFEKAKDTIQFVIFGGTWCDDTQYILPKFFKLQEMSGIPDSSITLFGVNRKKVALGHIAEAFNITAVPTIIIMKEGKEMGRVVEYGKTGKWDKELAEIIRVL
ncbi:thioredoxin family protein [Ferruginibacter sp. SUN002]|uniref:thioredoxin family protein n=1 Tax=Ferruginibacter sp. SUN002 TaxID=2937789 RepID=UPI003D360194